MIKIIVNVFLVLVLSLPVGAQNSPKELKKLFMAGYGDMQYGNYSKAVTYFEQIEQLGLANANTDFNQGLCYLNIPGDKSRAIPYLEKAALNISEKYKEGSYREIGAPSEAVFYLAKAYRINMQLSKAIEYYAKYKEYLLPDDVFYHDFVDLQIQTCKNAQEMILTPVPIKKTNLGAVINNGDDNFNPVITPDGQTLIYTTLQRIFDRVNQQETYYEIIKYTTKEGDGWSEPLDITAKINSDGFLASVGISSDGGKMYFFRDDYGDGNLYQAEKKGYRFTSIEALDKNINSRDWESHIWPDPNKDAYYFVSNRAGGQGGRDIYYIDKDAKGKWNAPKNLGNTINTPYDEDCPVISSDGNTLYFCSEAHSSMGGFDIFYSTKDESGNWSTPLNMGYPINSTDDDIFFMPYDNGKFALMALRDNDSYGGQDIFRIQLKFDDGEVVPAVEIPIAEKTNVESDAIVDNTTDQVVNTQQETTIDESEVLNDADVTQEITSNDNVQEDVVLMDVAPKYDRFDIRGLVLLQDSNEITRAFKVEVRNAATRSLSGSAFLSPEGQYSINVAPGNYIVEYSGPGYESLQRTVNIPPDYGLPKITVDVELTPKPVTQGEYVLMRGILFDSNSAALSHDAKIKLERLLLVMKQNPHLYVEVSGFSASSEKPTVSGLRADNVIGYLEEQGIEKSRFVAKAMGDKKPLVTASNTNPDAQKYNRRAEINVLKTGDTKIVYEEFRVPENLSHGVKRGVEQYTILLVDSKTPLQPSRFSEVERKGVSNVWIFPSATGYLYTIGKFASRAEASQLVNRAVDMGFPNASIINFRELEKQKYSGIVAGKKRVELEQQQNGKYTIQLLALKVPVETSYFKKLEGVERIKGNDGFYRYIWGRFDYKTALVKRSELNAAGYNGAFIMNMEFFQK